jgi:enediyne polyketide synthase
MKSAVAIIGMACRYPEARTPAELWENVLAQRQAFRRMPSERLRLEDYLDKDPNAPDRTYASEAALITDYEFDRVRYRVAGSTYRATDLTHWLALDIAAQALADAGYPAGEGLPKETTGVLLGNTLTGEFSRANGMRLRWPYVRRVVEAALVKDGALTEERRSFLESLEAAYKSSFPPITEETLVGSLSNTIAGRICNHFDLKGGGYAVDGACASSLLALAHACSALASGDLDVALAGGVDLSLDPFELVGFSKVGALARQEMRVYDSQSSGFWPGEGCGCVVLMRYDDARAAARRIYAVIRGWGTSSDGRGGITRPEVNGQLLALRRAYQRACYGIETVNYFEGHGTGTSVGDSTEIEALLRARREAGRELLPAVIGSIKANIGHTKAAAGVAGIINATMALYNEILPPTTGCNDPHPKLNGSSLEILREGKLWPNDRPLRAGVSAMGFGGVNTHITLERASTERRTQLYPDETTRLSTAQDVELFLLDGDNASDLLQQIDHLLRFVNKLSRAELLDLAVQMQKQLTGRLMKGAVVAASPTELNSRLETMKQWLVKNLGRKLDVNAGIFLGTGTTHSRIGFLFPGQASPVYLTGGAIRRRFKTVAELYQLANLPTGGSNFTTAVAQPAIVTTTIAALRVLSDLGINGDVAVGHSLGEVSALHWAGALDEKTALEIAAARGRFMGELNGPSGAMANISAGPEQVEKLIDGHPIVIACFNSPDQTVISGDKSAVEAVVAHARDLQLAAAMLPVSHAFHSPLVAPAGPMLANRLSHEKFSPLTRPIVSTVTGTRVAAKDDVRDLLFRQITSPVRFKDAVTMMADGLDLMIEVGPGEILTRLTCQLTNIPVIALDSGGPSLRGLLEGVGAAFALGIPVNHTVLFNDRFTRPFDLNKWQPLFFTNPCELAPIPNSVQQCIDENPIQEIAVNAQHLDSHRPPGTALEVLRNIIAERVDIPLSEIEETHRLLADLHLNSISVGQIVIEAARSLGLRPPAGLTDYAHATVVEIASALEGLSRMRESNILDKEHQPPGVDSWIRTFSIELVERPLSNQKNSPRPGLWRIFGSPEDPLKRALEQVFADSDTGDGVIVCLPADPNESHICLLLQSAQDVFERRNVNRFVVVQHGGGGAAFGKTLHLERRGLIVCIVDVPEDHPKAPEWVLAEATAAVGYTEAHYDSSGCRREPILRLLPLEDKLPTEPLGRSDVLVVTGGGKGIAAECALALARETGVRLALIGRSEPATDNELSANLARMRDSNINFRYVAADVSDAQAITTAIRYVESELGRVTAILHGAGRNVPQLLTSLDEAAFLQTLKPKIQGARNLLAAIDPAYLRYFVAFGSIIARVGMPGEADYAVANEWLARYMERVQSKHPTCRFLTVEWSIWSGVGMGERLGRVDALVREGITPITTDVGASTLSCLFTKQSSKTSVVVTGRCGKERTLKLDKPELPFLRFLERPRAYYPGVELVVDADISCDTDPYLNDHVFEGERLFPAVMALEAMAQAAMALVDGSIPPTFTDVKFTRPIMVPPRGQVTIRVAALTRERNHVDVVLRSSETSFQVDHFRATCRFAASKVSSQAKIFSEINKLKSKPLNLDPAQDLYGKMLFQTGRFARLRGYYFLSAKACVFEIAPADTDAWFGHYLPQNLVLEDPGARDTMIHSIQGCIPHSTLLPIGMDQITCSSRHSSGARFGYAQERFHDGDNFVYDLEILDENGLLVEEWEGLRLRKIADMAVAEEWPSTILGPYIERRCDELVPGIPISLTLLENGNEPTEQAIQRLLGNDISILRRPDGKPEVADGTRISVAHSGRFTLAVSGPCLTGCDLELVAVRSPLLWRDLLGPARFPLAEMIARQTGENHNSASTRVWTACECLKKVGAMPDTPLVLESVTQDGWAVLGAGSHLIASFVGRLKDFDGQLAVAVSVQNHRPR